MSPGSQGVRRVTRARDRTWNHIGSARIAVLVLLLLGALPSAHGAESRVHYLTGPAHADPLEIVLDYLRDEQLARGAGRNELAAWRLKDRYVTALSGITHLYLRQHLGGIEVYNGDVSLAVTADGRLVNLRRRVVSPALARGRPRAPALRAAEAVERAAAELGLTLSEPLVALETRPGRDRAVVLSSGGISLDDIAARLMYLEQPDEELRLVWNFDLRPRDVRFWWELNVDALTGQVLTQYNRVRNDEYRVFPLPLEDSDDGARTLEVDPADPTASPFGWHDLDGLVGADSNLSEGNNVLAAENSSMGAIVTLANGGAGRSFDFALDLGLTPDGYQPAAITNLFYWNNVLHDLHLQYGFDEAAGNFQEVHYVASSTGSGDSVIAFAQDFNSINNASMATPADGSSPIMRMHVWSLPMLSLIAPATLVDVYEAGDAEFGDPLDSTGIAGDVVVGIDDVGPSVTDGCSALTNGDDVAGKIALLDRGDCSFIDKVDNAETAGAIAAIIVDNIDEPVIGMSKPRGKNPKVDIPSILIRKVHGQLIKNALGSSETVTATLILSVRDSDLDNGVIIHEFGHGVSTRLTGGKSNASCLLSGQAAGMGEGWGDFWALALTAKPGDAGEDARPVGRYLVGQPGIRNFPYSTDLALNPQTFADIATTNAPHGVGEIWAQALWELFWIEVRDFGFDSDLYTGAGGNNITLQLVMDALKLQPCSPDFVDARDALLLADLVNYGQAHECRIWRAFAKRGLGFEADAVLVTENFALPPACPLCGDANVDGLIDQNDPDLLRTELAFPGTLTAQEEADCVARSLSGSCGLLEVVLLRRGLAGLQPGRERPCTAAP